MQWDQVRSLRSINMIINSIIKIFLKTFLFLWKMYISARIKHICSILIPTSQNANIHNMNFIQRLPLPAISQNITYACASLLSNSYLCVLGLRKNEFSGTENFMWSHSECIVELMLCYEFPKWNFSNQHFSKWSFLFGSDRRKYGKHFRYNQKG